MTAVQISVKKQGLGCIRTKATINIPEEKSIYRFPNPCCRLPQMYSFMHRVPLFTITAFSITW